MITIFELFLQVRPKGKQPQLLMLSGCRLQTLRTAVYPRLFRLTKLYTCFLKNQRELHQAFQDEKCEQVGQLMNIVEQIVGQHILDDISDYQTDLPSNAELQAIRASRQLDQETVMMSYQEPTWQLNAMKHISKRPSCAKNWSRLCG